MGRLTEYTPEIANEILGRISAGESLRAICAPEEMPAPSTVCLWVVEDREGFAEQYTRARQLQAQILADELFDISDDGTNDWMERLDPENGGVTGWKENGEALQRSRLRVDTRKWYLSKVLPKIYGDKIHTEHSGSIDLGKQSDAEIDAAIQRYLAALVPKDQLDAP
jgi:hypothetical protein